MKLFFKNVLRLVAYATGAIPTAVVISLCYDAIYGVPDGILWAVAIIMGLVTMTVGEAAVVAIKRRKEANEQRRMALLTEAIKTALKE